MILKTRLHKPPVDKKFIVRERLITHLDNESDRPLKLIVAGAGYGKSVLLSQWLDASRKNYCWISLEEDCNDLNIFLSYLNQIGAKVEWFKVWHPDIGKVDKGYYEYTPPPSNIWIYGIKTDTVEHILWVIVYSDLSVVTDRVLTYQSYFKNCNFECTASSVTDYALIQVCGEHKKLI